MYFSDDEVTSVFKNVFSWLRENGDFFFKETCYHSTGKISVCIGIQWYYFNRSIKHLDAYVICDRFEDMVKYRMLYYT